MKYQKWTNKIVILKISYGENKIMKIKISYRKNKIII
uniref:Uncharacterized protein n=1 Tax=Myoviridae sp. ctcyQ27 TaxID=2825139 RepID=A0A8S5UFK8_9CAUD|nr:MAG TPA: hypothetical protein [Myoviridae sp. ctcyQ27]